ncbi:acetylornithine deacetylase/Succinyl-diaminopimelate desuccinylase [Longilinea arvoryzae]|uniref:Acetylornithine deacetylase/Succinyl-diaminopimelate desuccinylase n=1 Tax=Longilinea arvoryzae TaxID=360412 RepID=A0A0S7BL48_9CHLR|nr:M20/M25/M40 family metallo-hydrolase [Longilinea arvoryzae]GAP15808.1 acetylornithine deacetylase/Succinyl-diaminopimelate desuccinylase [Longilinea arvoryzae]
MAVTVALRNEAQQFLMDLIRIPSTRGHEGPASRYVYSKIHSLVDECELVPIDDSIIQDPDYAFPLPGFTYQDTPNVECVIKGSGEGPTIVFNAHLDVVPPSEGQEDAFFPRDENGVIFGRGASDDKGQVTTMYALALLLRERGIRPKGDLIFHFVIEEENGGNGTLAMIRRGVKADAAIVLESSNMAVIPAVRGAVWFELKVFGRAAHSGNAQGRISALDKAFEAIQIWRGYHDRLLAESHHLPLFDKYADPMPLTIGQCQAGTWPSSVPSLAVLKGLIGFLPNKNRHEVQAGLRQALLDEGDEWLREHFELSFPMLNNDGNSLPVDHPLVTGLVKSVQAMGLPGEIHAMTAACDAWLYNNQVGIPTVVFGPGSILHAHSKEEQISIDDILKAAEILADYVQGDTQMELLKKSQS